MVDAGRMGEDFQPGLRRGTKPTGVRLYNERLVLSLIREHGSLPKADLARLTSLSPPTVSQIVGQLEADGLLRREQPQRGRIGQPSVPLSLNPDGALSFGVKIGRRSCDIVLMDFVGAVRRDLHLAYPYPSPGAVVDFVLLHIEIGGVRYDWYVFNLADVAIVAGVIALLYDSLLGSPAAKAP